MPLGLDQHALQQRALGRLLVPDARDLHAGPVELGGEIVPEHLELAETEDAGPAPAGGHHDVHALPRERGDERVAEVGLHAGDLRAQRSARGALLRGSGGRQRDAGRQRPSGLLDAGQLL